MSCHLQEREKAPGGQSERQAVFQEGWLVLKISCLTSDTAVTGELLQLLCFAVWAQAMFPCWMIPLCIVAAGNCQYQWGYLLPSPDSSCNSWYQRGYLLTILKSSGCDIYESPTNKPVILNLCCGNWSFHQPQHWPGGKP